MSRNVKPENTMKTGKRKAPPTAWKKGESGNPGGRPKMSEAQREAKELKANAQPASIQYLLSVVEDEDAETRDRIAAAKALTDDLKLEPLCIDLDARVAAEHAIRPELSVGERMQTLRVLQKSGALEAMTLEAETAAPVETQPEEA